MNEKSSLGRGLSTLIPNKNSTSSAVSYHTPTSLSKDKEVPLALEQVEGMKFQSLAISRIEPNPFQPRKEFDQQELENLSHSIRDNGVLQPLIVVKKPNSDKYELIAGERRWRASKLAGLKEVPVVVRDQVDEATQAEWALVENIQRQDLNPIERALSFAKMLEHFGLTQEQLAQKMDMSRSYIANTLRLLKLSAKIQKGLQEGLITEGHAKIMAGIEDETLREKLFDRIVKYSLSVKDLSKELQGGAGLKDANPKELEPVIENWSKNLSSKFQRQVEIKKKGKNFVMTVKFGSKEELEKFSQKLT